MSHLPKQFSADMLQLLNVALAARREDLLTMLQIKDGSFFIHSPKPDHYEVRSLEGPIAVFSLTELPGCCGVVVSYFSEVEVKLRNKGVGDLLLGVRMDAARARGYGQMLATVVADNGVERSILKQAGWVLAREFRNPKTNNLVQTYVVNL